MESGLESDRTQRRTSLFEKQTAMAETSKEVLELAGTKGMVGNVDVTRAPGLPDELVEPINKVWIPQKEDGPVETLNLSLLQRVNAVAVVGGCALAFGRGTTQAVDTGLFPPGTVDVAVPASLFLLTLNVASAAVGGSLARSKGRSVALWVFKGALAGLAGLLELRGLPDMEQAADVPS